MFYKIIEMWGEKIRRSEHPYSTEIEHIYREFKVYKIFYFYLFLSKAKDLNITLSYILYN